MLSSNTILQGRYHVIRQLGQGGMGTVYEAIDQRFDNQVALKETHFTDEVMRKAFEREARLLNKLQHPAMTRVIDHFTEGSGQYLVMDYVAGEDLAETLQRQNGPFPVAKVLEWGDQLLDVLSYIHTQEPPIIHRDIKPQNLKLNAKGRIMLLDFGLAKGSTGQVTTVATSRSVLGYSLAYAPLEQIVKVEQHWIEMLSVVNNDEVTRIQQRGTDPRSDLYSLAATLLHLMTAKAPPHAPTRALSVWSGRLDPLEAMFDDRLPRSVATVLRRAMALSMDERYSSAAEMHAALRRAAQLPETVVVESAPAYASAPTVQPSTQPASVPPPVSSQRASDSRAPQTPAVPDTLVVSQPQWGPAQQAPYVSQPSAGQWERPASQQSLFASSTGPSRRTWIIGGVAAGLIILVVVLIIALTAGKSRTPLETVKIWADVVNTKDIAAFKRVISRNILAKIQAEADRRGMSVDAMLTQELGRARSRPLPEMREGWVRDDRAMVEILDRTAWEPIYLVKEDGEWKVDTK
ncbi:MAG TPA: protein kinase [Pyrinomonadaceae bacterium]